MAKAKEAPPPVLQTYGLINPKTGNIFCKADGSPYDQLWYERMAFSCKWPIEKGGLTRYEHFRNICRICWPWLEWNPWMERMAEAFCNYKFVGVSGCTGASKTTIAMIYSVVWWLCGVDISTVVLTSTTGKMIRKRGWPWIQKLYSTMPGPRIGNMVDSKTCWQASKGQDKSAIFTQPVKEGSTQAAVAAISGMHNRRVLLVIDEATDTPEAIYEVIGQLMAGTIDFQVIYLGNPHSRFDPFGKVCEPKDGWTSVGIESDEWEARPQFGHPMQVIRLDAEMSPNIISGKNIYKHIPTQQAVDNAKAQHGENAPRYWQMWRGMWAPEGINQTVLTESILLTHEAFGVHVWMGGIEEMLCGFDPAFGGGDRAVMQFGKKGDLSITGTGLQLTDRTLLKVDAKSKTPVHWQLSDQVIANCKQRRVLPHNFGMDDSGEGGGLADILMREWSPQIRRIPSVAKPPERPVSNEDNRPAYDVYDRYTTYLWFSIREMIVSGQLKGLDASVAIELCNRRWDTISKKISIEPKTAPKSLNSNTDEPSKKNWGFKQFFGRSPDLGDALAILCEVAWRNGLIVKSQGVTAQVSNTWMQMALEADSVYVKDEDEQIPDNPIVSIYAMEDF